MNSGKEARLPLRGMFANCPAVDSLVDRALGAVDLVSFVAACRALDRALLWNYYPILLDAPEDTRIVYWNRFGRPQLPDDMYVAPFPEGWRK